MSVYPNSLPNGPSTRWRLRWAGRLLSLAALGLMLLPSCSSEPSQTDGSGGEVPLGPGGAGGSSGGSDTCPGGACSGGTGGGSGGLGGSGGSQPCTSEAPPSGARCADAAVRSRFVWWNAPCGLESQFPPVEQVHECALGCRNEDERSWDADTMFLMCEEGSVRGPGFPCTFDVDCRSPVGASEPSNLGLGGLGGAGGSGAPLGTVDEALLVCVSGACQLEGAAVAPSDLGETCTMEPASAEISELVGEIGATVGHAASCETGACLVAGPGLTDGICVTACSATGDCAAGASCTDVVDDRYSPWGYLGVDQPLRLEVCVPNP